MPTALIIGASRGIGHELARQYRADGWRVIATARKPQDLANLQQLGAEAHELDVTNLEAIAGLGWKLDDEKIDTAWLVAGLYGPRQDGFPTQDDFDSVMHTNVLAAMRLLPIVAPLVAATRGKLGVLSSRMGSIGSRSSAGGSLYRASKAPPASPSTPAGCRPTWAARARRSASNTACATCASRWRMRSRTRTALS
jgi:NAD(P)-dependent dehydrogenase (short-subunit alcohol dehydrogenase family)